MNSVKRNMNQADWLYGHDQEKKYNVGRQKVFSKVGKTYYILTGAVDVTGFRSWHQQGRPDYEFKGDWWDCAAYLRNHKKVLIYL